MQRLTQDKKNSYAEGVTWKRDRGTQIRNPRAEATIASIFASMAADLGGLRGDCGGTAEAGDLWMAVSGLGTVADPEKLLRSVGSGAGAIVLGTGIAMPMASERAPLRYALSVLACGWAS